jgi:hypothetical protein
MKPLLIAAALLLVPAAVPTAALAQVAAATVPNTFDRPAVRTQQPVPPLPSAAPAAAAPAAPMSTTPANSRSEDVLREIIAGGQAGAIPYALMTDDLAGKVRAQEAGILPLLQGFGAIQALDFVGSQEGADLYAVTFATAATQWIIGFDDAGKVDALLFRPAE